MKERKKERKKRCDGYAQYDTPSPTLRIGETRPRL
jgi:hypothetical protein